MTKREVTNGKPDLREFQIKKQTYHGPHFHHRCWNPQQVTRAY